MNWKEELINAKEEIIFLKRQDGIDFTEILMKKILQTKDNIDVLYIGGYQFLESFFLHKKGCDIVHIEVQYNGQEELIVFTKNKCQIHIYCRDRSSKKYEDKYFDIGILEQPFIEIPKVMKRCDQQIIVFPKYQNMKFINTSENVKVLEENEELPLDQRINNYRNKLFTELERIPMKDSTTMTRERIIGMIKSLDHIGR